jgi:alpha-ribazole phosphatase/probable phosphoglycerate mutase
MTLDLLRHGEPVGGRLLRGLQDDRLTDNGWSQMINSTSGNTWDFIATSPLKRCSEFAKYISSKTGTTYKIYDDLVEFDWGEWQGKSAENIGLSNLNRFKNDPINNSPYNSENLYTFNNRILATLSLIKEQQQGNSSVLIIAHAGVIRVIKSKILKLPVENIFNIKVRAGSCERFEV